MKTPATDHTQTVAELLKKGKSTVVIKDSNDHAYESGFAYFLMDNYYWDNYGSDAFIANITSKKPQTQPEHD